MIRISKALTGVALFLVAIAPATKAQESPQDAERMAAAQELVAAQNTSAVLQQFSQSFAKAMEEELAKSDAGNAKSLGVVMQSVFSPEARAMKKLLAAVAEAQTKILVSELLVDEMKQITAFLKSDTFKKFQAASMKTLTTVMPLLSSFQNEFRMDFFEALTKQQPKNAGAWNGLCWTVITTGGDPAKALDQCNTAIQLNPRCPNFYDSRGLVYLKLGDFNRALADYETALKLSPKYASAQYGRGIVKIKLGNFAGGSDDITAAKAQNAGLATQYSSYGIR